MTQRQIAIRIGLDGKADIQRDMNDVASSGDAAFGNLGKALDQATTAIQRQKDAFDKLTQAQAKTQAQQAHQSAINQVLGVNPTSGAGSAQASAQAMQQAYTGTEQRAAALRAQIDPLGAAQTKMNAAIADANTLLAAGAISETEHAAAVGLAKKAYADAQGALKDFGVAEEFGSTQAMALTASIRHMIDATVAGRPPLQALTMEAGNLSYGLSGGAGLLAAVKKLGAGIGSFLISPLGLAAEAFVVLGGAALLGLSRAASAEKEFVDATNLAGRSAGLTRDQFEAIATASSKADDISVNAARGVEEAFAKTGTVGAQSLNGLIALTKTFADKTGQNVSAATTILAKAFADPAKSGEKLLASMDALDDKSKQLIQTFLAQDDVTSAQKVLLEGLTKTLKDATDQTTWYGDALDWVKRAASGAAEALGHVDSGPSLQQQKSSLENELAYAKAGKRQTVVTESGPVQLAQRSISDIEADLDHVNALITQTQQKAKAAAADVAANNLSNIAGPLVRSAIPGFDDLKNLKDEQTVLDKLTASPAALAKVGVSLKDVTTAQEAYNNAVGSYIDPATKAAELNDLAIKTLTAKTPAEKAALAEQREQIELSGKVISIAQENAKIQQAGALAYAQAQKSVDKYTDSLRANLLVAEAYLKSSIAGISAQMGQKKLDQQVGTAAVGGAKRVAQLKNETDARKALNDQVAAGIITTEQASLQMQTENALAPLRIAYDLADVQGKKVLTDVITALTQARAADNAEALRSRALGDIQADARQIDLLKQQIAIANDNDSQRQVELAVLQKRNQLLDQGQDINSATSRTILAQVAYATQLDQQLDLAKASRGELEDLFGNIASTFSNFIIQGKLDWKDFGQAALSVLQDIESELIKLAVINPLMNGLFGQNAPTLGSVGGVLGDLFGGGISEVNMTPSVFGTFHSGGMAEAANSSRKLSDEILAGAPRLHGGAFLSPNEIPAILEKGERVLNRQDTKDYNNRHRAQPAPQPVTIKSEFTIHVTGTTDSELLRQVNTAVTVAQKEHDQKVLPALIARFSNDPRLRTG